MNNNQATLHKIQEMKLLGMLRAFKNSLETKHSHDFTPDELVSHLVDAEFDDRNNRRIERLLKAAKFRYQASIEEVNFTLKRNLNKNLLLRLSDCSWIDKHQNVIFTGPTGVGKSFLASALGHHACINFFKVGYFSAAKLFPRLKLSKADGSYPKEINKISKLDLFILDDFGLDTLDKQSRLSFLEILEDRHGRKSTLVVSQLPPNSWHDAIGDPTIADACCDRIIHSSHRIELKGGSLRKLHSVA